MMLSAFRGLFALTAPFGHFRPMPLVSGHHVNLVDLDFARQRHRRRSSGQPAARLLRHGPHV